MINLVNLFPLDFPLDFYIPRNSPVVLTTFSFIIEVSTQLSNQQCQETSVSTHGRMDAKIPKRMDIR